MSVALVTDSLNCDDFVLTDDMGVTDHTVRPMPDSLRRYLKLPPYGEPPASGPRPEPPNKPPA
jgi:hypothetical protein